MIGRRDSFFAVEVDADAEARPCCRCESGTRIGLCRRIARFFCVLPILQFPAVAKFLVCSATANKNKQAIELATYSAWTIPEI